MNSDISSIGSSLRISQMMNQASSTMEAANPASIGGDVQPIRQAFVMASRNAMSAAADSAAPIQSKEPFPLPCRSVRPIRTIAPAAIASSDTGIPAKNIERQPSSDTSKPPTIGPDIAPVPIIVM